MTLNEFLPFITNTTLILLALSSLAVYYRHRREGHLDAVLMFGGLGLIAAINLTQTYLTGPVDWLRKIPSILLVAHPYLLLRLVNHLRVVHSSIQIIGIFGMLASVVVILLFPLPLPPLFAFLIVIYFAFIELYASVVLIKGAWKTSGVTHYRLMLAASGSILLAVVIIIAGINAVFPPAAVVLSPVSQVIAVLAVLSYYFGFATPTWLRRSWQYAELYRYLQQRGSSWYTDPLDKSLERLCMSSTRSVGGHSAAIVINSSNDSSYGFKLHLSTDSSVKHGSEIPETSKLGSTLKAGKSAIVDLKAEGKHTLEKLVFPEEVRTLLCIPLHDQNSIWGYLGVLFSHDPLFPEDDLALLELYGEQKSLILGYLNLLEEQKKHSMELERKVIKRTEQLEKAVKDLQKEIKARQEAAKELEAFAYTVSHDLRAPLRAIDGFSQVLEKKYAGDLTEEAKGYFNRIIKNVQQMGQLIDDLLAFSRLGRQAMNLVPVNPKEIVNTALNRLGHEIQTRNIDIILDDLPPCIADPRLLTQVYTNLISNAVKFTRGREKACIEIGYKKGHEEMIYYVKDNGAGFSMEYVDKLFGVFQRLHKSEDYEGTGVGLANIQRIIQRHGGRVWAEGEVDNGAAFFFSLPEQVNFEEEGIGNIAEASPEIA
jgi:signal transduction histidine kinase